MCLVARTARFVLTWEIAKMTRWSVVRMEYGYKLLLGSYDSSITVAEFTATEAEAKSVLSWLIEGK